MKFELTMSRLEEMVLCIVHNELNELKSSISDGLLFFLTLSI